MAIKTLNANAELMGRSAALFMNINAAKGLQEVMKTNLGPKGTVKMLVGGAGDLKLTKDGNVLLREMQIQNPTAIMIARTAVAQDDVTGDGTSTIVLLIGELMHQAERHLAEGLHPRVVAEGFDIAKRAALEFLETYKRSALLPDGKPDKSLLTAVARTALRTKLRGEMADQLTDIVAEAVLLIRKEGEPIDLHMIETMAMRHRLSSDTRLVKGLVLDHGARHPDMKKYVENAYILTCNISLEYEKSEVNASFMYSSAAQRESMVDAERKVTDDRVKAICDFKHKVCDGTDKNFVVITQKGIDPPALEMLCKAGIVGLRRAKRRNMERLVLACGGTAVDAVEELELNCLGFAGKVYEHVLGDDAFTFVEDVANPFSCTVLIKGPNDHSINQIKDAVRDGLRAVKNTLEDGAVVPGAGAFEVALSQHLLNVTRKTCTGRVKLGVQAFADALLVVPKTLAENSGYETQTVVIALQEEADRGNCAGVDVATGEPCDPCAAGIFDNYVVKLQTLNSAPVIATQLLLVDEVMRAGVNMRGGK